jgi:hypothetical protein
MAHPEPPEEATDALAVAEEAAAREAAQEAGSPEQPKVVRPRARTSRKANADPGSDPGSSIEVIPPAARGTDRPMVADTFSVRQGGIQQVSAVNVQVSQGGIGRASAEDITVSQGGVGLARGGRISVEMGGIGAAIGSEVHVTQGGVGSVLARDVRVEQAVVRTVVANQVRFDRTTAVLFLVARRVEGDVKALLDWRGALAFGAAFGVVVSIFRRRK